MFKVFGRQYDGVSHVQHRMSELQILNRQHGPSDDRVTEINALNAALEEHAQREAARRKAAERPYVLLYRKALPNGETFKGRRTFRTDTEQAKFIREAPDSVAITFYTH